MTVSGLAWATKVTVHMLRQHIWETAGLGLLPFKQSCKMLFVVAVRGCKGLLGKTVE